MQFVPGRRKGHVYLTDDDHYLYTRHYTRPVVKGAPATRTHWMCSQKGCKATAATKKASAEAEEMFLSCGKIVHNHVPDSSNSFARMLQRDRSEQVNCWWLCPEMYILLG